MANFKFDDFGCSKFVTNTNSIGGRKLSEAR